MLRERAEGLGSNTAHEHLTNDRGRDPRAHGPSTPGGVVPNTDMDESKAFTSRKAHVRPRQAALGPRPAGMGLSCSSACTQRRHMQPARAHTPLPAPSCAHRGSHLSQNVVESGDKASSNGKSARVVCAPAQAAEPLNVSLATWGGGARCRPSSTRAAMAASIPRRRGNHAWSSTFPRLVLASPAGRTDSAERQLL